MDGFSGFKTATTDELAEAMTVMDPFHVVRLAGNALDERRRRVSWTPAGVGAARPTRSTLRGAHCTPGPICLPTSSPITPGNRRIQTPTTPSIMKSR